MTASFSNYTNSRNLQSEKKKALNKEGLTQYRLVAPKGHIWYYHLAR
jgi:hypothetical protein